MLFRFDEYGWHDGVVRCALPPRDGLGRAARRILRESDDRRLARDGADRLVGQWLRVRQPVELPGQHQLRDDDALLFYVPTAAGQLGKVCLRRDQAIARGEATQPTDGADSASLMQALLSDAPPSASPSVASYLWTSSLGLP